MTHPLTLLRTLRGQSQKALAQALGVSPMCICGLEAGGQPRLETVQRLAAYLPCTLAQAVDLMAGTATHQQVLTVHEAAAVAAERFCPCCQTAAGEHSPTCPARSADVCKADDYPETERTA